MTTIVVHEDHAIEGSTSTGVRSMTDVIEVGNLYDQAQLKRNKFTALFTEDGIAVGKRGIESRKVTVSLDYNGAVGPEEYPAGPNASVYPAAA